MSKIVSKRIILFITICLVIAQAGNGRNKDKTYILVHGAWHGAWCWNKVIPLMTGKGYKVIAPDLPGHGNDTTNPDIVTFADYVNRITETAGGIEGEVILVGHSMGGTVISQAAEKLGKRKVCKLIYLDAFLPGNGESVSSLAKLIESTLPDDSTRLTIGSGLIVSENGKTSTFRPEIADELFYNDCSQADRDYARKNLGRQAFAPLGTPVSVTDSVYGEIPKYYILCTESRDLDKSILPERIKCEKIVKMKTGHSPFFSKPEQLARILLRL